MDKSINGNEKLKYKTSEAMSLINEDHSLIFESIKNYEKGKNILKYAKYGVYPGSGIVNVYDNCVYLQPGLNKKFLDIEWKLITEIKEKKDILKSLHEEGVKGKNSLKNIVGDNIEIYTIFEALDFMKNTSNKDIEMEWIENKNYGRTRLRFEGDTIVKDYNRTCYTFPQLTDEFLNGFWKVGIKKEIKLQGKSYKNIEIIMEETRFHCVEDNKKSEYPVKDILEYGTIFKKYFDEDLKNIIPNTIEIREDLGPEYENKYRDKYGLYSNGKLLFGLSLITNWHRIGFELSKEDAKGIIEYTENYNLKKTDLDSVKY